MARMERPLILHVLLLLLVLPSVSSQLCIPTDMYSTGKLEVRIFEATQAELSKDPNNVKYVSPLGLVGKLSGGANDGVILEMRKDYSTTINPSEYFQVFDGDRGLMIRLKHALDRDGNRYDTADDTNRITFIIGCTPKSGGEKKDLQVIVNVVDVNDNAPAFQGLPYQTVVNELTPVGTTIFRALTATDRDAGLNRLIDFHIVPGSGSHLNASKNFRITEPRKGLITVAQQLDFESLKSAGQNYYTLNISATDASTAFAKKTSYTTLKVVISDGDDQGPAFEYQGCVRYNGACINAQYTATVKNNIKSDQLNIRPGAIRASDMDTLNYPVTYSITKGLPEGTAQFFDIDSTTGTVKQKQKIARKDHRTIELIIKAQENSFNQRFQMATLTVTVLPTNEYKPTVKSSYNSFTGYIYENSRLGTQVKNQAGSSALMLQVTDQDQTEDDEPGQFSFRVDGTGSFAVTPDGYIVLNKEGLDYETTKEVKFKVLVSEKDNPQPKTSTTELTVKVMDVNDNVPTFPPAGYSVNVREGDGRREVVKVTASDEDSGVFGSVKYSILSVSNDGKRKFAIDDNGQIYVTQPVTLDDIYILVVQGVDQGTITGRRGSVTMVTVTVVLAKNLGPQIPASQYLVKVSEGVEIGSKVFSVPATDRENDKLKYSIIRGNDKKDFTIDTNSGMLQNTKKLDREKSASYSFVVAVKDAKNDRSATTTVLVTVTDINDNNPIFTMPQPIKFKVRENLANELVGTVRATDADLGANGQVSYSVPNNDPFFNIDATNGQIRTKQPLDYEAATSHTLEVTAYDAAADSRSVTVSITVEVEDVEDMIPIFKEQLYVASVPENEANYLVTEVEAVDQDEKKAIHYFIKEDSSGKFTIDERTGKLKTRQKLDYEKKHSYKLIVSTREASGKNKAQYSATVTVTVLDRNDFSPVFAKNSYTAEKLRETVFPGTPVVKVKATDGDPKGPNSEVRYSIESVQPSSGLTLFYISPESGQIVVSQPLTSDRQHTRYVISVMAKDLGSPTHSSVAQVKVEVARNNHAPTFNPATYASSIDFNKSPGSLIKKVSAGDADGSEPFNQFTFTIVGDGKATSLFEINRNSGDIKVKGGLAADTDLTYVIRVRATDGGGRTGEALVTVTVNRNLKSPNFNPTQYTKTVQDNEPLSSSIIQVKAKDDDVQSPHKDVIYTLTGDATALEYFMVDAVSGYISLKKSLALDPGKRTEYTLTISAKDKGLPTPRLATNRATVKIKVIRNKNAPIFFHDSYSASLAQNKPVGTAVKKVEAKDGDTARDFKTITYKIIGDDTAPTYFAVNPESGQITIKATLESDIVELYRIRVIAHDNGYPARSATAIVYVTVTRNFHPPTWSQANYNHRVLETQPLGVTFVTVKATDQDKAGTANSDVSYLATGDQLAVEYFNVDSSTGNVSVKKSLLVDQKHTKTYKLSIVALDAGNPQLRSQVAKVTVEVIRNENSPQFEKKTYPFPIDQNVGAGKSITVVKAKDPDAKDRFGIIRYEIIGDDTAPNYFSINPESGEVKLKKKVETDTLTGYQVRVRAFDNGSPPKSDIAVVKVTVNRNLHSPKFDGGEKRLDIFYTQVLGETVTTVHATDTDKQCKHDIHLEASTHIAEWLESPTMMS
ncbi:Cadherin-99C [Lamellibrachia satsuma]|nr:Cadherin-99C [Lamellibrachia satsuma]